MSQQPFPQQPPQNPPNPYQPTGQMNAPGPGMGGGDAGWQLLSEKAGMIKIVGILMIVAGAIYCLGIIYAIIGIPMIIMGMSLTAASTALSNGRGLDPAANRVAGEKLGTFFQIAGVLAIIGIALMALAIVGLIVFVIAGVAAGGM